MVKFTEDKIKQICDVYISTKSEIDTARIIGCSPTTVCRYVKENGLGVGRGGNQKKQRKITDDQLLNACKVMSRQEIADHFNMHPENLSRRMRKLGVYALKMKSDGSSVFATNKAKTFDWHETLNGKSFVEKYQGDCFEFVAYKDRRYRLRCKQCGFVIERASSTIRQKTCKCDACEAKAKEKQELQNVRERLILTLKLAAEKETPKTCAGCGKTFYSQIAEQKYCSKTCKKRNRSSSNIRKRCRKYGADYEKGITLRLVSERDNGICQICGKKVDWNDRSYTDWFGAMYPTIDHKIALANGGTHSWDNVQLAHAICNSFKRDLAV